MPHYRGYAAAVCLLLLGQAAGCQADRHEELRGKLYFAAGQYLAEFDLRSGDTTIVTSLGDVDIRQISSQKGERLLLTVFGLVNQQEKYRLVLYDIDTRQALTIVNGRNGHYLPGTEVLLYDDGVSLVVAERDNGEWRKTEAFRHAYNATLQVMPVSATRFLYAPGEGGIHAYDIVARRAVELPALSRECRLDAALWDLQRERLLCRRPSGDDGFEYALVRLDGEVTRNLPLPDARRLQPVAFLPDQDAVVLTERWKSRLSDRRKHAVWIYRFDSGELYRLVDNQHLGRSVVYARH